MFEKSSLKKILILSDWYEPGYKAGGPIQSIRNFVTGMHNLFDIAIITSDTDLGEAHPYPEIPSDQWISAEPGIRIYYASKKRLKSGLLKGLIQSEQPDFIYLNSLYSVRFSILPLLLLWRKKIKSRFVLSPRGMLRESALKIKTNKKKLFISFLNLIQIPAVIVFHATDTQEKKDIGHYFPRAQRIEIVPNFSIALPERLSPIEKKSGMLKCVFISRIMGIKNILFFLQILKRVPDNIQLDLGVYGEIEDEKYWLEAKSVIQALPGHVHVKYYGPLPHKEVYPTLEAYHIFVLPTLGENFGHAIFEALSAGRPVLISNTTPWLGLREREAGWVLPLDDSESWLKAIQEAAAFDQHAYDRWSMNARHFAKAYAERSDLRKDYIKIFS